MACPICDQATVAAYKPFCSKHCADVDLARWFNGTYTTPMAEQDVWEDAEKPSEQIDTEH